jgi:hypothetical protein
MASGSSGREDARDIEMKDVADNGFFKHDERGTSHRGFVIRNDDLAKVDDKAKATLGEESCKQNFKLNMKATSVIDFLSSAGEEEGGIVDRDGDVCSFHLRSPPSLLAYEVAVVNTVADAAVERFLSEMFDDGWKNVEHGLTLESGRIIKIHKMHLLMVYEITLRSVATATVMHKMIIPAWDAMRIKLRLSTSEAESIAWIFQAISNGLVPGGRCAMDFDAATGKNTCGGCMSTEPPPFLGEVRHRRVLQVTSVIRSARCFPLHSLLHAKIFTRHSHDMHI